MSIDALLQEGRPGPCPATGEATCFCSVNVERGTDLADGFVGTESQDIYETGRGNDTISLGDGQIGVDLIKDFDLQTKSGKGDEDTVTLKIGDKNIVLSSAEDFVRFAEEFDGGGATDKDASVNIYLPDDEDKDVLILDLGDRGVVQFQGIVEKIGRDDLIDAGARVLDTAALNTLIEEALPDAPDMMIRDNNAFLMAMGTGSRIEIHAADASKDSWTQLSKTAMAGDTHLHLAEATGWEVGDVIAIAPSGRDFTEDEVRTVVSVSNDGRYVELNQALEFNHYGETERYGNGKGDSWKVDMRAEVGLLSRNVKIQGDEDSVEDGFGAHTMIMNGASQHISGAEFFRVGQEDILGRYPIHWHMLGDGSGQYVENSSIHHTYQKGSTIHGTFNVRYEENVIFDHVGHGVFLEDGSEHGSQILGNLVFGTKASQTGLPIPTDMTDVSSYWIENSSNTFVGNHAAGSQNHGFMIVPARGPHGESAEAFPDVPNTLDDMVFRDNTSHSSRNGLFVEGFVDPETLEHVTSGAGPGQVYIEDHTSYGNTAFGMWFRGSRPFVDNAMLADNRDGIEFHTRHGILHDSLIVGDTENVAIDDENIRNGLRLYVTGQSGIDGVHIENIDASGGSDGGIHVRNSTSQGISTWVNDLTFDNVEQNIVWQGVGDSVSDAEKYAYNNRILDLDGSLSGKKGAFLANGIAPGYDFRAGFEGEYDPMFGGTWITTGGTLASTDIRLPTANGGNLSVTRSDGVDYPEMGGRSMGNPPSSSSYQFLTATGDKDEAAYLLDFQNLPSEIQLNVDGLRDGEAITYEIPNVGSYEVRNGDLARPVQSFDDLFKSDTTAVYSEGGSLFVRVVGSVSDDREDYSHTTADENPAGEFLATEGGRYGNLKIRLTEVASPRPYGVDFTPDLLEAIEKTKGEGRFKIDRLDMPEDRELDEIHDSTSDTANLYKGMARWSNEATWLSGAPGEENIVVINAGQTILLDQDVEVEGIIINGGELIVADESDIELSSDYVLVINGGLFQVGTEKRAHKHDFTLTLEGDDKNFDLNVTQVVEGVVANAVFAAVDGTPQKGKYFAPSADMSEIPYGMDPTDMDDMKYLSDGDKASRSDDSILGTTIGDRAHLGRGDDWMFGGDGIDIIHGHGGNDYLLGGADGDKLFGWSGHDILHGGSGDDIIRGGRGNDQLFGGGGNDTLFTRPGNDMVDGGAGIDTILLGRGSQMVTFKQGGDTDIILRFNHRKDKLDLSDFFEQGETVDAFLADHATQDGKFVRFDFDDGSSLLLKHKKLKHFDEDNIVTADQVVTFDPDEGFEVSDFVPIAEDVSVA